MAGGAGGLPGRTLAPKTEATSLVLGQGSRPGHQDTLPTDHPLAPKALSSQPPGAYGRARLSSSSRAAPRRGSTGGRTRQGCCTRRRHPAGTGSGPGCRPARRAPAAPGPGTPRRPWPSAASRTRRAGGRSNGGPWARLFTPSPFHPARAGARGQQVGGSLGRWAALLPQGPHPGNSCRHGWSPGWGSWQLTCSEQDWAAATSSGSSHTASGLLIFCMFPNWMALKGTPGGWAQPVKGVPGACTHTPAHRAPAGLTVMEEL